MFANHPVCFGTMSLKVTSSCHWWLCLFNILIADFSSLTFLSTWPVWNWWLRSHGNFWLWLCQNYLTWHGHAVICGRRWLIFDAVRTHHSVFSRPIKKKIFERNKLENSEKTQRRFTVVLDGFEVFSVKHSNQYPHCRIQFKNSLVSLASRSLSLGPHLLNLSSDSVRLTLTSLH